MNSFNSFSVSWIIVCIHISSYIEFRYNNWKNKVRIFEYLRISMGVIVREGVPRATQKMADQEWSDFYVVSTMILFRPGSQQMLLALLFEIVSCGTQGDT